MTFICIQAGHYPRTSGATGAPGEQELTWRITQKLSQVLQSKGFQIQIVGADPPASEINKDFDLFIALHGDANIYGTGGGVCGAPDPSVDAATAQSTRIRDAIRSEYFNRSGIVDHPERYNRNIAFYYMWAKLTAKTPCVLLEMGVVQDAHDKVILADTDIVTNAIARGICKAFNVPFDPPTPPTPPADPCAAIKEENRKLAEENGKLKKENEDLNKKLSDIKVKVGQFKVDLKKYIDEYNI